MVEGTTKPQLVALLKSGADEQRAFIVSLSAAQRVQIGTSEKWSAKDTLAHNVYFQARTIRNHQLLQRGETPPALPDITADEQSVNIFLAHRDQPWPEVIAAAEAAFAGLIILLDGYSEADLMTPNQLMKPNTPLWNTPLWREFLSNGYTHPLMHYADFYLEHGDLTHATDLQKRLAKENASFGDDELHGDADYNLACFYAKTGQIESALALLSGALKLAPRLVEWSKEDPDLVSLHAELGYQALYG